MQNGYIMKFRFPIYNYTQRRSHFLTVDSSIYRHEAEAVERFFECYQPIVVAPHATEKQILQTKTVQVCRFCSRDATQTTFKKTAHVLPQACGNKFLVHDEECDECNARFSEYETSFGDYTCAYRVVDMVPSKQGYPTAKNVGVTLRIIRDDTDQPIISIETADDSVVEYNDEKGYVIFKRLKSFRPMHVYKTLLKIGFSLLPTTELLYFKSVKALLHTNRFDQQMKGSCKVKLTLIEKGGTIAPIVYLYQLREEKRDEQMPHTMMTFTFGRYQFQLPLTDTRDLPKIERSQKMIFMPLPPVKTTPSMTTIHKVQDFSNPDRCREVEQFKLQFT